MRNRAATSAPYFLAMGPLLILPGLQGCTQGGDARAATSSGVAALSPGNERVLLALDEIRLSDLVPFLETETGKRVELEDLEALRSHRISVQSRNLVPRSTVPSRVLNQLRLDGLDVVETDDVIYIQIGDNPNVGEGFQSRVRPIDSAELLRFLGVHAWKARITVDSALKTLTLRLVRYERDEQGRFSGSLLRTKSRRYAEPVFAELIRVMWRDQGAATEFEVAIGSSITRFEIEAERLRDYRPHGLDVASTFVKGERILAVRWKGVDPGDFTLRPNRSAMQGYLALELELSTSR